MTLPIVRMLPIQCSGFTSNGYSSDVCMYVYIQKWEDEFQQEMERQRVEKEKEIARLRAQQEGAKDKQAEKYTT